MGFVSNAYGLEFEDLEIIAKQREELHRNHVSSRPLSKSYELIGLVGEWLFARLYNLNMDLALRPAGDGRVDFAVNEFTIDVKSANKPYYLFREVDVPHADVLVLAGVWLDKRTGKMFGWEFDKIMLDLPYPPKVFNPAGGIVNYYKPAAKLRSMNQLVEEVL